MHKKLANTKTPKPMYTTGFLPKLSEIGPKINCPKPKPKNIIVINSWFSFGVLVPTDEPIGCKAGSIVSMDKATIDIKQAISNINSN